MSIKRDIEEEPVFGTCKPYHWHEYIYGVFMMALFFIACIYSLVTLFTEPRHAYLSEQIQQVEKEVKTHDR